MTQPVATTFCMFYEGTDHENHEININTLGKSLSALGNALTEANAILNGDAKSIDVRVNADLIPGSVGIAVEVFQNLQNARDVVMALGLCGGAAATALGVIDWLKGDEITIIDNAPDGMKKIHTNSRSIDCPEGIAKLVNDTKVRKSIEELIREPLQNPGTSSFAIRRSRDATDNEVFIDKESAHSYVGLTIHEAKSSEPNEATVKFTAADVNKPSGWKALVNGKERKVRMEDVYFLERLSNMEEPHLFGRSFTVILRTTTIKKLGSETTELTIERVCHENMST
ncbi:hypothetical protein [Methylobacter tundripaludum]|uniref:hypothetical protein n=1 Tax=Methylobacter tundripaludum TaxID=173365 RepID=UPI000AA2567F|nr:hypothetical protein [Methylobacter tundripaludum]